VDLEVDYINNKTQETWKKIMKGFLKKRENGDFSFQSKFRDKVLCLDVK